MKFTLTSLLEQLVLIIGTKLERIITKMAAELTNKTAVTIGLPNVMLSDELFWFKRPQLIIKFIHFILFQVNLYSTCMCFMSNMVCTTTFSYEYFSIVLLNPECNCNLHSPMGHCKIWKPYTIIVYTNTVSSRLTFQDLLFFQFTFKEDSHSCLFRSKISIGVSLALG